MSGLGIAAAVILGAAGLFLLVAIVLRLRALKRCQCGHPRRPHRGSDCALCECPRWTRRYSASELTDLSRSDIDPHWQAIKNALPGCARDTEPPPEWDPCVVREPKDPQRGDEDR